MSLKRPDQIPYEASGLTDVFEVRGMKMDGPGDETAWDILDRVPNFDPTHIAQIALDLADPGIGDVGAYAEAHLASFTNDNIYDLSYVLKLLTEEGHAEIDPVEVFKQSGFENIPPHIAKKALSHYAQFLSSLGSEVHMASGRTDKGDLKTWDWETEEEVAVTGADIALGVHREVIAESAGAEFREITELMLSEPDIDKRAAFAREYKAHLLQYCRDNDVKIIDRSRGDNEFELPLKLRNFSGRGSVTMRSEKILAPEWELEEAADAILATISKQKFEERFREVDGIISPERLEELRLVYGAKAASLIALSEVVERVNEAKGRLGHELSIPEFKAVPAELYIRWKAGGNIDAELRSYFEWASELKIQPDWRDEGADPMPSNFIVRSSAVYAEDGEELSGAGIYDSEVMYQYSGHMATFEDFKATVLKIYGSVDDKDAVHYREQHGVEEEAMGLVIQAYVEGRGTHHGSYAGYINTVMPGVPGLVEIRAGHNKRNMYHREPLFRVLGEEMGLEPHQREVELFPSDIHKVSKYVLNDLAEDAAVIERIWGRPVQIEFVCSDDQPGVSIVQVRSLTTKETDPVDIEFPDEPEIVKSQAVGVGDMILRVLHKDADNTDEEGVVIVGGNHEWTFRGNDDGIPKSGAVIMTNDHGASGHVQTICAEKGVLCLFPDDDIDVFDEKNGYVEAQREDQLRIVSNGIVGKVYKVAEEDRVEEKDIPRPNRSSRDRDWFGNF